MKKKTKATVLYQCKIADGIYDLWLESDLAKEAHAGQFIGVYTGNKSKLLPRPISICQVNDSDKSGDSAGLPFSDGTDALRLVYRVTPPPISLGANGLAYTNGSGTSDICEFKPGDKVNILGILGNGYDIPGIAQKENIVLMGGGIGIPPMLELARELKYYKTENNIPGTVSVVLGYRNSDFFLKNDFENLGINLYIATEDGSFGTKGNVLDVMRETEIPCDVICACGPMPMLRAIVSYAKEHSAKAFISLEERMACGVGACLGCITKTKEIDHHSHVYNTRICTDGPVFDADDLDI